MLVCVILVARQVASSGLDGRNGRPETRPQTVDLIGRERAGYFERGLLKRKPKKKTKNSVKKKPVRASGDVAIEDGIWPAF